LQHGSRYYYKTKRYRYNPRLAALLVRAPSDSDKVRGPATNRKGFRESEKQQSSTAWRKTRDGQVQTRGDREALGAVGAE
jgi:hypothetical protein